MTLRYQSGEEIRQGDHVLFHCNPARIEFVVVERAGDPAMDWYIDEFGGGAMVRAPHDPNPTFLPAASIPEHEDLEFVSRAGKG
jgi:hypothetical protein